jgi:ribosome biogenesis GTPase
VSVFSSSPERGSEDGWSLADLGWSAARAAEAASVDPGGVPGRVIRADRGRSQVAIDGYVLSIETNSAPAQPAVGDWVTLDPTIGSGRISSILRRATRFSRATALSSDSTSTVDEQILAANVDLALVVEPAIDPNPRRLERELLIADGATRAVVVVTKLDLVSDVAAIWKSLEPVSAHRPLIPVSAVTGEGLDRLRTHFEAGTTLACFGASGVGKSTLINALLGEERMETGAIREDDGRGRHTTVTRELFPLGNGVTVIDMPGIRALSTVASLEAVDDVFADVVRLAIGCRFGDCAHQAEPGCAVLAAIEAGELTKGRLTAYQKLLREAARQRRRTDPLERDAELRKRKAFGRQRRRTRDPKHQR